MIFGKQLCQSYQKLAQLSRTHFVFFRNPSTAEKFNFQWHASFGFIDFFLEISIFLCRVWPLCQNDRAEHFFHVWKKIKLFLIFLCYWEARTSLIFSWSKTKSNWAPLEKWWRTKIFSVRQSPYFFAWETILQNQSLRSQ